MIFLFGILQMNSQNQDKTYIKGNALSILLAVPNVGIETSIGKKTTFQVDVLASFWKSITLSAPNDFINSMFFVLHTAVTYTSKYFRS